MKNDFSIGFFKQSIKLFFADGISFSIVLAILQKCLLNGSDIFLSSLIIPLSLFSVFIVLFSF